MLPPPKIWFSYVRVPFSNSSLLLCHTAQAGDEMKKEKVGSVDTLLTDRANVGVSNLYCTVTHNATRQGPLFARPAPVASRYRLSRTKQEYLSWRPASN